MDEFESFLKTLAQILKFPTLKPDPSGSCLILLQEQQIPLLFEWDDELVPNTVLVSAELMSFPIEYRQDVYYGCLKANSSLEETLSVKPDEDYIYLHKRLHPEIEEKELRLYLDRFVENSVTWRENFQNLLKSPPSNLKSGPSFRFPYRA